MKALIVYDSVFGNTEKIAQKISESLGQGSRVVRVTDIDSSDSLNLDYLIVGSPTRAFRPTKPVTGFLDKLKPKSLKGIKVAAFDTRMSTEDVNNKILSFMVNIFGYANKPIEDRLVKKGGTRAVTSEGFIVLGTEGPLKEGELGRAAEWAHKILDT